MSKSDYLENAILDHILGGGDYVRPATVYFALFTSDPGEAAGGTEATGTDYARVAVTNNATNFPAASGGAKSNGTAITFPAAGAGGWSSGADMTHWVMFDASSGGNRLYKGPLAIAKPVLEGDVASIPVGDLDITED